MELGLRVAVLCEKFAGKRHSETEALRESEIVQDAPEDVEQGLSCHLRDVPRRTGS